MSYKDKYGHHHIHVRCDGKYHTISVKNGFFIDIDDLVKVVDKILSDSQHKELHKC